MLITNLKVLHLSMHNDLELGDAKESEAQMFNLTILH